MVFKKDVKKLFGKPGQKEEIVQSTAATDIKPHVDEKVTDAGSTEILFTQDFGLWFGKSIFESSVAEIIQKEHLGHKAITLIDVAELVAVNYASNVSEASKGNFHSEGAHFGFYRYVYSIRCESDDALWEVFRRNLSSKIASSCTRLRNEKVPELPAISLLHPTGNSIASISTPNTSSRASSSSSFWSSSSSSRHSPANDESVTANEAQRVLQPVASPVPELEIAPKCTKCGRSTSWKVTKPSNRNGNAGRPYYKCLPCNKFCCFTDMRGNDPANPLCYCGTSSRKQISGENKHPLRQVHYVCVQGTCDYYQVGKSPSGDPICLDEEVANQMRRLNLL
ncbi:hypothetical protein B0J11DRAFT_540200 [Dendryphion nanum]|uniref:GRF-like zinc ribbon domain-containing protein n=1 Tax=Dendryphion nanum TaxID=256645 RepID=A0A9P9D9V7_9PLEO|nr:hypothetical protein B0J11DRAFT_540200 [Dendryphion nanum]